MADEVGLGKTIEAGLVLCQYWAERKRRLLIICPAALRKQWSEELLEKFNLPSQVIDSKTYQKLKDEGVSSPLSQDVVSIMSYHYAAKMEEVLVAQQWDLVVIDEAHKLRNAHQKSNKMGQTLRCALSGRKKLLLTATPLQNSLMEIYGLSTLIDEQLFGDDKALCVNLEIINDKEAKTAARFIRKVHDICPVKIKTILTDNGKEFTDRFTANGEREPTGKHMFDQACNDLTIEHRLIPPKHPQTNGMVERFNGRISQVVKTTHFANIEEMKTTLNQYMKTYNHHIVQRNLDHLTPIQTMKKWYREKPELFNKKVYEQAGLDNSAWAVFQYKQYALKWANAVA